MKKQLTQTQRDYLALTVVQGTMPIGENFVDLSHLAIAGYVVAGNLGHVKPTTKGVRASLRAKDVLQDGILFRLPESSPLKPRYFGPEPTSPPHLRVVPEKPADPFVDGFDTAMAGGVASNTWTDLTQAAEYDEGFRQGAIHRQQTQTG